MAIIISQKGKKTVKVEKSDFAKENVLQQYIYENPESIPLYDLKEDARLLILAREFPTASGPIDALGVDRDGEIYIIETKLFRNPDKRTVVAQALDYGAALWKHSSEFPRFLSILEEASQETFSMGAVPLALRTSNASSRCTASIKKLRLKDRLVLRSSRSLGVSLGRAIYFG
jgi:hypothetical protein